PNGNTFIATYNELLEVTRGGKVVLSVPCTQMVFSGQKLRDGHIVYVHSQGAVVELDARGREVRSVPVGNTGGWASADRLRNGRYLVAQYSANKVVEVDSG